LLVERETRRIDDLGDPEIGQFDRLASGPGLLRRPDEDDVLRLEVAMDDPHLMGAPERARDLGAQVSDPRPGEGAALEGREERLPLHVFHHQVGHRFELAVVRDLDDVRVVDPIDGARLAQESLAARRVEREIRAEDLDRAEPFDDHVPREVHVRHPARPEPARHAVARGDRPAEERIGRLREGRSVERTERRIVGLELRAARADPHE